jgi:predicted transcriptional regulator
MAYKTGSIGEFMRWTKRVVTDPAAAPGTPKSWFDSDETAAKSLGTSKTLDTSTSLGTSKSRGTSASPEAMVKLLSAENLTLLHLIATHRPDSVRALAVLTRRKESNLSRTLKKLHEAGIVDFEQGAGRMRAPRLVARRVTLDLDLVGPGSLVSVQRAKAR